MDNQPSEQYTPRTRAAVAREAAVKARLEAEQAEAKARAALEAAEAAVWAANKSIPPETRALEIELPSPGPTTRRYIILAP